MLLEPSGLLAGKYRIESMVGQGAYGRVYRARDIELERTVAIKELRKGEGEVGSTVFADYADRFRREARVQARFNHANIVQVYELLVVESDALYLVMEYMGGGSLRQQLDEQPRMKVGQALRLMSDLLNGLERAHTDPRDIVHRDVKPANILLASDGRAKLGDFGLAQVGDESIRTQSGKPHPGTPQYMSPEQASTTDYLSPASDIFSAGCVLFEMLSGMGYKQMRFQKKTLNDLCPGAPPWLVEVLVEMLAQDPEQRAHDARELRERLRQGLRQQKRQGAETTARREAAQAAAEEKARREAEEKKRQVAEAEARRKAQDPLAEYATMIHIPERKFWIGKYPVTNELYQRFLEAPDFAERELWVNFPKIGKPPGYQNMGDWGEDGWKWLQRNLGKKKVLYPRRWKDSKFGIARQKAPVVDITWYEANAYCKWLFKHWSELAEGAQNPRLRPALMRLPTEAEWVFAAGGDHPQGRYPWDVPGKATSDVQEIVRRANVRESKVGSTTAVDEYPQGISQPYGLFDLAGNVWEWQASDSNRLLMVWSQLALRGGSWSHYRWDARVEGRFSHHPDYDWDRLGFRVLVLPS